jgi:hypothetical protein
MDQMSATQESQCGVVLEAFQVEGECLEDEEAVEEPSLVETLVIYHGTREVLMEAVLVKTLLAHITVLSTRT